MSNKFTASNGIEIDWQQPDNPESYGGDDVLKMSTSDSDGFKPLSLGSADSNGFTEGSQMNAALSEFYLHQAGVWVDRGTGALVMRTAGEDDRRGRAIAVLLKGCVSILCENVVETTEPYEGIKERYFAAHPKPRKPWHDAKIGEAWAVTIDGRERVMLAQGDRFTDGCNFWGFNSATITDARRIWPEREGGVK